MKMVLFIVISNLKILLLVAVYVNYVILVGPPFVKIEERPIVGLLIMPHPRYWRGSSMI